MNEELNRKLAEWAGWQFIASALVGCWQPPTYENVIYMEAPAFTHSLDACFKWLVPNLRAKGFSYELLGWNEGRHKAIILSPNRKGWAPINAEVVAETPALALCLAIEKLIDKEVQDEWHL